MRHLLNRLARPVALLVVAAQLLLGLPAMASAQVPHATAAQTPCVDMPTTPHDGCPCCPEGSGSMKNCLAMCSLAAAAAPSVFVVAVMRSQAAPFVDLPDHVTALSEPPLKPPPIG